MGLRDNIVPAVPGWNICVETQDSGGYGDLKNALVYADRVYWNPFEILSALLGRLALTTFGLLKSGDKAAKLEALNDEAAKLEALIDEESYDGFNNDLHANGLASVVTVAWNREEVVHWIKVAPWEYFWSGSEKQPEDLFPLLYRKADEIVGNSRVVVIREALATPRWNAHARAHVLMEALSRLMLPDVSTLPLGAIAEMRDRLQDTLDPLRAEMLQLSDELRKLTAAATHDELIGEAEELISTRVEPVVRMANARARELAKSRWRKFFVGIAKSFGFAGAGLLSPGMLTKALEEALAAGASIAETKESEHPAKASATFVLKARRLIARHDYS
jgi:hypothetical protein